MTAAFTESTVESAALATASKERVERLMTLQKKTSLASRLDLRSARELRDAPACAPRAGGSDERRLQPLFIQRFFERAWTACGILASPLVNVSDWGCERLREDWRWQYWVPPVGNAKFAWVQHLSGCRDAQAGMIYHLAPTGIADFVLANGSMSSGQSGEAEIRAAARHGRLVHA